MISLLILPLFSSDSPFIPISPIHARSELYSSWAQPHMARILSTTWPCKKQVSSRDKVHQGEISCGNPLRSPLQNERLASSGSEPTPKTYGNPSCSAARAEHNYQVARFRLVMYGREGMHGALHVVLSAHGDEELIATVCCVSKRWLYLVESNVALAALARAARATIRHFVLTYVRVRAVEAAESASAGSFCLDAV